jgi:hypothetical protein
MLLFIKDIPRYSTSREIARFLEVSRGGLGKFIPFIKSISVDKCEILRLEDTRNKTVEYHGLISVQSEKSCLALLDRFKVGLFNGQRVEVRPFIKRSIYKDRRKLHADLELLPRERRKQDRRRHHLHIRYMRCRKAAH